MTARRSIFKRDITFAKSLKDLPYSLQPVPPDLFLPDVNIPDGQLQAYPWRHIIRNSFDYARKSLYLANTNQHYLPIRRTKNDGTGRVTIDPWVIEKAYYFRYFCIMLTACGDKLANYLREYFMVTSWPKGGKATIENTTLPKLCKALDSNSTIQEPVRIILDAYITNDEVKKIIEIGKAHKHRWPYHYKGEGVKPSLPVAQFSDDGKKKSLEIGAGYPSKLLADDINKGRIALNAFADTCEQIEKVIGATRSDPARKVTFYNW